MNEDLEPRLEVLNQFLRDPGAAAASSLLDGLLAGDFRSSALRPPSEKTTLERDGITARVGPSRAHGSLDRGAFVKEITEWIQPLRWLETAASR